MNAYVDGRIMAYLPPQGSPGERNYAPPEWLMMHKNEDVEYLDKEEAEEAVKFARLGIFTEEEEKLLKAKEQREQATAAASMPGQDESAKKITVSEGVTSGAVHEDGDALMTDEQPWRHEGHPFIGKRTCVNLGEAEENNGTKSGGRKNKPEKEKEESLGGW